MTTQTLRLRRRVRVFALIWSLITILMGVSTFIAIYMVYGLATSPRNNVTDSGNVAIPVVATNTQAAPVAVVNTAIPTVQPTVVPPTATIQAVVQAATEVEPTEAPPTPTTLPVNDQRFQAGTQVQVSPDLNPDNQETWMREVRDKLHMGWFKQQVRWEDVQPEPNSFNWAELDLSLPLASEYGLKVMLSVVTAHRPARAARRSSGLCRFSGSDPGALPGYGPCH
jgi:hypothetical protein